MKRHLLLVVLLAGLLSACTYLSLPVPAPTEVAAADTPTQPATATATRVPPSATASPIPTPTPTATTPPTATPDDLYLDPTGIRIHPEPVVYGGDIISFEVIAAGGGIDALDRVPVAIYLGAPPLDGADRLVSGEMQRWGLGDRLQASFFWVWDTDGLSGPQTVTVWLDPDGQVVAGDEDPTNNRLTFEIDLLPREMLPEDEQQATWRMTATECCVIYTTEGSAAHRDIALIAASADRAAVAVSDLLGQPLNKRVTIYMLDRILGHGGFASSNWIALSYLDRMYAGGDLDTVMLHEMSHIVDRDMGRFRPSIITEGLAVVAAGGHYKPDGIRARAAALVTLDMYIPFDDLVDDFYLAQHEIGYMQAAGFVQYLIDSYGWDGLRALYAEFANEPGNATQSQQLDAALRSVTGLTLAEAEASYRAWLAEQPHDAATLSDVQLTVYLYDSLRRYQQYYDPSAYFLTAWLPDMDVMVDEDIVADTWRHPDGRANLTLELMLIGAIDALEAGDFDDSEALLDALNTVIDSGGDLTATPLSAAYAALVDATLAAGYTPQQARFFDDGQAEVLVRADDGSLTPIVFAASNAGWALSPVSSD